MWLLQWKSGERKSLVLFCVSKRSLPRMRQFIWQMTPSEFWFFFLSWSRNSTDDVLDFMCDFICICRYGLAGAVLSNDLERCDRVSKVSIWLIISNCTHLMIKRYFLSLWIMIIVFSGFRGGNCVGQLLSAMLLPSSMGRNQTQWIWPWVRRMVSLSPLL